MAQRSLYLNGESFYLKSEKDYNKRLEIVNEFLEKYPEQFSIDVKDENEFKVNSARLDFLTFYLLYDIRDEYILSLKQFELIYKKEKQYDF